MNEETKKEFMINANIIPPDNTPGRVEYVPPREITDAQTEKVKELAEKSGEMVEKFLNCFLVSNYDEDGLREAFRNNAISLRQQIRPNGTLTFSLVPNGSSHALTEVELEGVKSENLSLWAFMQENISSVHYCELREKLGYKKDGLEWRRN